jgi:predicted DCC family thiol-disulfide oxidoreductase YuxK
MSTPLDLYPLTLLYDGACPVCNLEMDNLKARNTEGLLRFVDISVPQFDATPYGASITDMNALIHALRPDGSLVVGVEVFRLAYSAVGLGHVTVATGWPLLRPLADAAYAVFARNRYGFSKAFLPLLEGLRSLRAARRSAVQANQVDATARQATQAASACHQGQCRPWWADHPELVEGFAKASTSPARTPFDAASTVATSPTERSTA